MYTPGDGRAPAAQSPRHRCKKLGSIADASGTYGAFFCIRIVIGVVCPLATASVVVVVTYPFFCAWITYVPGNTPSQEKPPLPFDERLP